MSTTESTKPVVAWTDKERFTYLFALIENKVDYNATPRPVGRTMIACQRMMDRLKQTIKPELDALHEGRPIEERTPKKATPASTPRKRKVNADADSATPTTPSKRGRKNKSEVDDEAIVKTPTTPTKRGRKKKSEAVVEEEEADADDEKEVASVKPEPQDEDMDMYMDEGEI